MKRFLVLMVFPFLSGAVFSQTLFTYGNSTVDKEEFMRAYNKNKAAVPDREKALREYLDLYIKFKLKVKAALELRLDTLQQLQYDLQNFRSQVDETYLSNEKEVNQLIDEAFMRSQKDLHTLHFFIAFDDKKAPADTLTAFKAGNELRQELLKRSNTDFDLLAKEISLKYVPVKYSDIGFVTTFSVPYAFENRIYSLKPGEVCAPFRSRTGYHIFKVTEERAAAGKWRIAQILFAFPPGNRSEYMKALQQRADSVYNVLQHGGDFSVVAKQASDDKITYVSGGELPEFGSGKYENAFEKEVFKLTSDGEISHPFETSFGIHIVKRIKQTPVPADRSDANQLYELKQKVLLDPRINEVRERFSKGIISKIGYKRNALVKEDELYRFADSAAKIPGEQPLKKYPVSDKTLFSFGKSNISGADWLGFVRDYKNNPELYKGEDNAGLFNKFISRSAQEYYKKHLEEYNADFRYQMEEFREGNILFEIMEKRVWGNAANDSGGLVKLYNEHKSNYRWAPSASVILFSCSGIATANESLTALKSGKNWKKIVADGGNNVQADSGRYEIAQLPLNENVKAAPGLITDPVVNPADGTTSFLKIISLYEGNLQRSFEEARGLVINDYQNILEEKWIQDLKNKYPVKVNEAVFNSLLK